MSAESRVAVLMTLMRQLQEVMRAENGLLRDLKLVRLRELQAEKSALAGSYEVELRRLREAPGDSSARSTRMPAGCSRTACASSSGRSAPTPTGCCSARSRRDTRADHRSGPGRAGRASLPGRFGSGPASGSARVIAVAFDRRC